MSCGAGNSASNAVEREIKPKLANHEKRIAELEQMIAILQLITGVSIDADGNWTAGIPPMTPGRCDL